MPGLLELHDIEKTIVSNVTQQLALARPERTKPPVSNG